MSDEMLCDFCSRAPRDVKKMFVGPSARICDECVRVCVELLPKPCDGAVLDGSEDASGPEEARVFHLMLCAWNGVDPDTTPAKLYPANDSTRRAWLRVYAAAKRIEGAGA